jgi:hypothetical protein
MPRAMSPERELEYQQLFAFVAFCATHVMGIDPADINHPKNTGERIVQDFGKSKALEGMRQATNDIVEMLSDKQSAYIAELDATLLNAKVITASEVRRRYAASYRRIVKRGKVQNDTEYYLVKGIVSDLSSSITKHERVGLEQLLRAYGRCGA